MYYKHLFFLVVFLLGVTFVSADANFTLSYTSGLSVNMSKNLIYTVTINNTGTVADTFIISLIYNSTDTVSASSESINSLASMNTANFTVTLNEQTPGKYNVTINIVSSSNASVSQSVTLNLTVNDSCTNTSSGDWIINGTQNVFCYGRNIVSAGSLYVRDTANLIFNNSVINSIGYFEGSSTIKTENSTFYKDVILRNLSVFDAVNSNFAKISVYSATDSVSINNFMPGQDRTQRITSAGRFAVNFTDSDINNTYFYGYGTSANSFVNSSINTSYFFGASVNIFESAALANAYFYENTTGSLEDNTSVSFLTMKDRANLSFYNINVTQIQQIGDSSDDSMIFRGNVTIANKTLSAFYGSLARYLPVYAAYDNGSLVSSASIQLKEGNSVLWSGTLTSGYAEANVTFNSSNYNKNITLYADGFQAARFTLVNDTPVNFVYDITAPGITLNSPQNNSYLNGSFILNVTTNDESDCRYRLNYLNFTDFSSSDGFNHTASLYSLNNSQYNISVNCTNLFNLSATIILNITFNDTTSPTITILIPSNSAILRSSYQPNISFTADENSYCQWKSDLTGHTTFASFNSSEGQGATSFYKSLSNEVWLNGNHNITINCTDISGNSRSNITYFIMNDTVPPSITNLSPSSGATVTDSSVTLKIYTNENATCKYRETDVNYSSLVSGLITDDNLYHHLILDLSDGSYDYYVRCIDLNGNSMLSSHHFSFSVDTSSSGDGSTGDSSSDNDGSSSSDTSNPKSTKIWSTLETGSNSAFITNTEIAFTELDFYVKTKLTGVTMIIEKLKSNPTLITPLGEIYQYLSVSKTGLSDSNLQDTKIKFRLEKTWLNSNNVDEDSIKLYRYVGGVWNLLSVTKKDSDSSYIYYEAATPGFSYFVVSGTKKQSSASQPVQNQESSNQQAAGNTPSGLQQEETLSETSEAETQSINMSILYAFIVIMVLSLLFIYRKKIPVLFKGNGKTEELKKYIQEAKSEGKSPDEIKKSLLTAGWDEKTVDMVMHNVHVPTEQIEKLNEYILFCLRSNKSKQEIKSNLLNAGWQEDTIEDAFNNLKEKLQNKNK